MANSSSLIPIHSVGRLKNMMAMADYFAPDINFTPARAVYPTASGGSLASAGGAMSQNTTSVGINGNGSGEAAPVVVSNAAGGGAVVGGNGGGKGLWYWLGFLVFLVLTVWVARKAGGDEDFRNLRPTFYNFLTITLTAILGIVGLKVIFARFRVPGLSDLVMAV